MLEMQVERIDISICRCPNQIEGEVVCDSNMCAGIESPIGAPHCVNHLTKHGAVDVEVSHSLSDRRNDFIEPKAEEEGAETVSLRDAIRHEARSEGS